MGGEIFGPFCVFIFSPVRFPFAPPTDAAVIPATFEADFNASFQAPGALLAQVFLLFFFSFLFRFSSFLSTSSPRFFVSFSFLPLHELGRSGFQSCG